MSIGPYGGEPTSTGAPESWAASRAALREARRRLDSVVAALPAGVTPGDLAEQFASVATLLEQEPRLRRALSDPSRGERDRVGLLTRIFGSHVTPPTLDVLSTLVSGRFASSTDLYDAVEQLSWQSALTLAEQEGRLDDVEDELFRFARILDREPRLALALAEDALPRERKLALLEALLHGRTHPVTRWLLERVATRPSRVPLDRTVERLAQLAAARRQRSIATVRVAQAITEEQATRLQAVLSRQYGRPVDVQVVVDPEILGGVVVSVGEEMIDGSVAHRLDQARQALER